MSATAAGEILFDEHRTALGEPDPALVLFARGLTSTVKGYAGQDRRREPRYDVCLNVLAIPLDAQQAVCGEPLVGVTWNVSASGVAILTDRRVQAPCLAVEIGSPRGGVVRMILNVLRARQLGNYFELAGTFSARL